MHIAHNLQYHTVINFKLGKTEELELQLGTFHKLCLHFLAFFDHVRP